MYDWSCPKIFPVAAFLCWNFPLMRWERMCVSNPSSSRDSSIGLPCFRRRLVRGLVLFTRHARARRVWVFQSGDDFNVVSDVQILEQTGFCEWGLWVRIFPQSENLAECILCL